MDLNLKVNLFAYLLSNSNSILSLDFEAFISWLVMHMIRTGNYDYRLNVSPMLGLERNFEPEPWNPSPPIPWK